MSDLEQKVENLDERIRKLEVELKEVAGGVETATATAPRTQTGTVLSGTTRPQR